MSTRYQQLMTLNASDNNKMSVGKYSVTDTGTFYQYKLDVARDTQQVPFDWKFHISVQDGGLDGRNNLAKAFDIVERILMANQVYDFKVVKATGQLSKNRDEDQAGKQITLYTYDDPRKGDLKFWQRLLNDIEHELNKAGIVSDFKAASDISVTGSKYCSYRNDAKVVKMSDEDTLLSYNSSKNPNISGLANPYANIRVTPKILSVSNAMRFFSGPPKATEEHRFSKASALQYQGVIINQQCTRIRNDIITGINKQLELLNTLPLSDGEAASNEQIQVNLKDYLNSARGEFAEVLSPSQLISKIEEYHISLASCYKNLMTGAKESSAPEKYDSMLTQLENLTTHISAIEKVVKELDKVNSKPVTDFSLGLSS